MCGHVVSLVLRFCVRCGLKKNKCHFCTCRLPDWALNVLPQLTNLFDKFAVVNFSSYIRTNETIKAKTGFLLREIFDRFKNKTLSLLNPPNLSLFLYSAHDNVLINTLSGLEIFDVN